jgi:hypothetical protein
MEWYETWKARPKENPLPTQKDRWKDFFVTMVRSKEQALLYLSRMLT